MRLARKLTLALALALPCGCGDADAESSPSGGPPPDAGAAPACAAGEATLPDGTCLPAGIPSSACGAGFAPDPALGCRPILPAESCPPGQMAIPGETTCRDVAPCGEGPWGDIAIDASTEHVDGAYAGGASDGSAEKPWTTIQEAVDAAEEGAIVAIAAGTYEEDVRVQGSPVRLWGRCPALVQLVGSGDEPAAVVILMGGADGTEVRDLAVSSLSGGIVAAGAEGVVVERVWVTDARDFGVAAVDTAGPTDLTLRRSLVEDGLSFGALSIGVSLRVEESVIRAIGGDSAVGITCSVDEETGNRCTADVRASLVEAIAGMGMLVDASDALVERTVVTKTVVPSSSPAGGGVIMRRGASVFLAASTLLENEGIGVFADASDVTIETSVVDDTRFMHGSTFGRGIDVEVGDDAARANLLVRSSIVSRSREVGVFASGADATLESTVVRDSLPSGDDRSGGGVVFEHESTTSSRSVGVLRSCVIENMAEEGIGVWGSTVTVEATLVRRIAPRPSDGLYGDGILVVAREFEASLSISGSHVEKSARAGLSAFGAVASLGDTSFECNAIDLDGEAYGTAFTFEDAGGNSCGCAGESFPCEVVTVSLEPPEPMPLAP